MEPQNVALRPQPHRRSHHWGVRSARVIVFPAAKSIITSTAPNRPGISCVIISRHAPQGGPVQPSRMIVRTRRIASSPLVIMLRIALRSAQIPSVQAYPRRRPYRFFPRTTPLQLRHRPPRCMRTRDEDAEQLWPLRTMRPTSCSRCSPSDRSVLRRGWVWTYWYLRWDSNPQHSDFESDASANWATEARRPLCGGANSEIILGSQP